MNPYATMPSIFTLGHKPIAKKIKELQTIAESGLIPTTFGDVVHIENRKYSILSRRCNNVNPCQSFKTIKSRFYVQCRWYL